MALFKTALIPFLLMVRKAEVDILNEIHSPSSGTKNFLFWRFGLNLLFVFLLEKETLFPTIAFFPVKSQILDMALILKWTAKVVKISMKQMPKMDRTTKLFSAGTIPPKWT